jgi:superfamily I DNA/RNA helicase
VPWTYWRDEIDYVIKGRGITAFEVYASLRRVGRRTSLKPGHRELVWEIYTNYESQLREQGVIDFNDQINIALAEVTEHPLDVPYSAVIADEVQDLSCQAARLLAQISDEGRGLLVVGDGQQQIYPGGYTLAEAGISVAGRSTILRTNYRNAASIIQTAAQVVASDDYYDLDAAAETGRRDISLARDGGHVWTVNSRSPDELRRNATGHIQMLISDGHSVGDMALLCETNAETNVYLTLLKAAGINAMKLANYVGATTDAIKVGTVNRAKGLEFKHVIRPIQSPKADPKCSAEARQEEAERSNRQLFVAMTRARDTLWIGRVA